MCFAFYRGNINSNRLRQNNKKLYCIILVHLKNRGGHTETVLYADVLFLIDFSMDTVTLWLSGKLTHCELSVKRCVISAAFGAFISLILTVLSTHGMLTVLTGILCAFVMTLIAYGKVKIFTFIKRVASVWAIGMVMGGIMTYLLSFDRGVPNPFGSTNEGTNSPELLPMAVILSYVIVYFIKRTSRKSEVDVEIKFGPQRVCVKGFVDSGNKLREPISGEPVIILSLSTARLLFGKSEAEILRVGRPEQISNKFQNRQRVIPATGATGNCVLIGIRPDEIYVNGSKIKCYVAVNKGTEDGPESIVPADVL